MKPGWLKSGEGGAGELLKIAFPLILSSSFMTLQVTIDRILLSRYNSDAVGAAWVAVLVFWTPLAILQQTAAYATTFVAQYVGAGRSHRVGPAIWQALYFSLAAGVAFLAMIPLGPPIIALTGHEPAIQELEIVYFTCLCFATLPMLLVAAASSFFAGRGDSWTVLWVNGVGFLVNAVLDYAWIFGEWGFPEWGMAGAGWATVVGSWASALLGLALMWRHTYREEFCTLSGWRFEGDLFRRLMRFGLPSGVQWALDGLAFTIFTIMVGRLGPEQLAATSICFTINMVAILPMLGMGQAVGILVGQRLGQDRPEVAERSTWAGFRVTWLYMAMMSVLFLLLPGILLLPFENTQSADKWASVAGLVPVLLRFVAVYCLFDSMSLIFSFALKGAGDTRFVTVVSLVLSWPMMVLPTWAAWYFDWGLYWAWAFASSYIIALALIFLFRFRHGKWKTMRVIEAAPPVEDDQESDDELELVTSDV